MDILSRRANAGIDVRGQAMNSPTILDLLKGKTVIVVPSEMTELLGITDRIAAMSNVAGWRRKDRNHSPKKKFFAWVHSISKEDALWN